MLQELCRETYDLSVDGKVLPPKKPESKASVAVFLRILDSGLDFIAEEQHETSSLKATLVTDVASVVLSVNYGGEKGYTAKVLMEKENVLQELAVDGGVDAAERKLRKVLTDPAYRLEKKKKKTTSINLRAIQDEDKYPYQDRFRT